MQLDSELSSGRSERNEQVLVEVVGQEVCDRLQQSLHPMTLQTLGNSDSSFVTDLPRQGKLRSADVSHQSLSVESAIYDLFDQPTVNGRLLLVGPTGIGKTTALLELAAELVQRAKRDPEQPIPVIFHLSSWPVEQQSFEDWLRAELRVKYGVSQPLSNRWLEANILLPLLDGLDELAPHRWEAAVQHLNAWSADHPGPLVVCCRRDNHDRSPVPLALNGTLELEPLTADQLEQLLISLHLDDLWVRLQQHPEWLELMRVPLWLNLFILTRHTLDFAAWERLKTSQEQQNFLLDAFIVQQLHQSLNHQEYVGKSQPTIRQMRHWLGWLAQHINEQSEHEFLIENLQPTLLSSRRQIIQYSLLGGLIFALMGGLIFSLFIGPGSGLLAASFIATLFVVRRGDDAIVTIDAKPTTTSLMQFILVRQINYLLFFPLLMMLVILFAGKGIGSIIFGFIIGLIIIIIARLAIALPSWLIGSFVFKVNRFFEADIAIRTRPNQSIQETLLYVVRSVALFIPLLLVIRITPLVWSGKLTGQITLEVTPLIHIFGVAAAIALWATIFDSALVCAQHLALRLVLFQAKALPWNYARFLNACCDRHLLQRVGGRYQFIHRLVQERFAVR